MAYEQSLLIHLSGKILIRPFRRDVSVIDGTAVPYPDAFAVYQAAPLMAMQAHSTAIQDSLREYKFGRANSRRVPGHRLKPKQVGFPVCQLLAAHCICKC